jgi:hypothetical protein
MRGKKKRASLPTELLIQHSLEQRKSVRLKVAVLMWDTHGDPSYQVIPDSVAYLEVNTPGLVWRVVGQVVQSLKRLEIEMEREDDNPEQWLHTLPREARGRPKGSTKKVIPGSERDTTGDEPAAADEDAPIGFV